MANVKPHVKEIVITVICFVWLLFVATNVNITLGQTYLHFTVGSLVLLIIGITIFDKTLTISWQKSPGGTFKAILWGLGGWIALLITSILALRFIDPANANLASVMGLMGATTPALATSKIANLITFGVAIAFIETQLWARMLEFFCDLFHIPVNKQSFRKIGMWFIIGLLSLAFLFFHLTAKGITNTSALAVVFIMMAISMTMVVIFGETRQAVFMHCWANTVASYLMLFATGALSIN